MLLLVDVSSKQLHHHHQHQQQKRNQQRRRTYMDCGIMQKCRRFSLLVNTQFVVIRLSIITAIIYIVAATAAAASTTSSTTSVSSSYRTVEQQQLPSLSAPTPQKDDGNVLPKDPSKSTHSTAESFIIPPPPPRPKELSTTNKTTIITNPISTTTTTTTNNVSTNATTNSNTTSPTMVQIPPPPPPTLSSLHLSKKDDDHGLRMKGKVDEVEEVEEEMEEQQQQQQQQNQQPPPLPKTPPPPPPPPPPRLVQEIPTNDITDLLHQQQQPNRNGRDERRNTNSVYGQYDYYSHEQQPQHDHYPSSTRTAASIQQHRQQQQQQQQQQHQESSQQQQQQQQQHRPNQQRRRSTFPPKWKLILQKAEHQIVDTMSNLDTIISDNVQQLYTTTKQQVQSIQQQQQQRSRIWPTKSTRNEGNIDSTSSSSYITEMMPSSWTNSIKRRKKLKYEYVEQLDLSRFRKTIAVTNASPDDINRSSSSSSSTTKTSIIGTNGGASNPHLPPPPPPSSSTTSQYSLSRDAGQRQQHQQPQQSQRIPDSPSTYDIRRQRQQQQPYDPQHEYDNSPIIPQQQYQQQNQITKPLSERLLPQQQYEQQSRTPRWPTFNTVNNGDGTTAKRDYNQILSEDGMDAQNQDTSFDKPKNNKVVKSNEYKFDDDDSDNKRIWKRIPNIITSMIPFFDVTHLFRKLRRSSSDYATLDAWDAISNEKIGTKNYRLPTTAKAENNSSIFRWWNWFLRNKKKYQLNEDEEENDSIELRDLLKRFNSDKKTSSMLIQLNSNEENHCSMIGRNKATWDVAVLLSIIAVMRELIPLLSDFQIPSTIVEALTISISNILSIVALSTQTWIPIFAACGTLAVHTRYLHCVGHENNLITNVQSSIRDQAQYGSLLLRLTSAIPMDRNIPELCAIATRAIIVSKIATIRLQTFITSVLTIILVSWLSAMGPLINRNLIRTMEFFQKIPWQSIDWQIITQSFQKTLTPSSATIYGCVLDIIREVLDNKYLYLFRGTLFLSLIAVGFLPKLSKKYGFNVMSTASVDDENDIDKSNDELMVEAHLQFTEQLSQLVASGANRLRLSYSDSHIQQLLRRWKSTIPPFGVQADLQQRLSLRWNIVAGIVGYGLLSIASLTFPFLALQFTLSSSFPENVITSLSDHEFWLKFRLESLLDCALTLMVTQNLAFLTLISIARSSHLNDKISAFVKQLDSVITERKSLIATSHSQNLMHSTNAEGGGIVVNDLWASHATKRAWAVRGASVNCQNGEVVAVLGDDGAGKSRFMTSIAEAILISCKSSTTRRRGFLSTTKVRGTITIGGIDVAKWSNYDDLQKTIGIELNDLHSVCDAAQVLSGLTLEEIIDPDYVQVSAVDSSHRLRNLLSDAHSSRQNRPNSNGKAAMMLALQVTGLDNTLMSRLPLKLSTTIVGCGDELMHQSIVPVVGDGTQVLSYAEWSKVLFTRTIAQSIYDNHQLQSRSGSNNYYDPTSMQNCLTGSILLLDDLTLHMTELEEIRVINNLRRTNAATIVTSNRWMTIGLVVDRIVIVKDGAIIEMGTHQELISRGPQGSYYASKWYSLPSSPTAY